MTSKTHITAAILAIALAPIPSGAQGPGVGPGAMQQERKIVAQFDKDNDKRLNAAERREARIWLENQPRMGPGGRGRGPGGPGGPAGPGGGVASGSPGARLSPTDVKTLGSESLYDAAVLRTLFFEFENEDWEKELAAFNNTDVEVPATLIVDGKTYKDVGLHFRGQSSLFSVPEGLKRSLNVSLDFVHGSQNLLGYTTLNLLNSHGDPTYLRTVMYMQAAREYVPAPMANYVRVVINGENWGIYVSAQQFNKGFVNEWFNTTEGARWKVPGSPNGRGGLEYLGDDPSAYKRIYEIKSKDDRASWDALIRLTKTLNTTPLPELEQALAPMLDVDGVLKFLALEVALVNNDGYWTRASDYSLYLDRRGVFHVMPHDANETFGPGGGGRGMGGPGAGMRPGMPGPGGRMGGRPGGMGEPARIGGPPGGRAELDPLIGLDDATKPLRSRLLNVPALRARYLTYVQQIAAKWLDWNAIGPLAQQYQSLIAADVRRDTRKLDTFEAFEAGVAALRTFTERRRSFLTNYK